MKRAIFVTGTDTGVGKSVLTGLLARYLTEKGKRVITQKWIQSGTGNSSGDISLHLRLMGRQLKNIRDYADLVCPYVFRLAASPHLAARREKKKIILSKIKKSFRQLSRKFDFVVVEGIGGALVPVDSRHLVIDIARDLKLPVLVVALNKLGAINHALMTIESLKKRKMKILGIIFNNAKKEEDVILKDNPRIVETLGKQRILGVLSRKKTPRELYRNFLPIGKKICKVARII